MKGFWNLKWKWEKKKKKKKNSPTVANQSAFMRFNDCFIKFLMS